MTSATNEPNDAEARGPSPPPLKPLNPNTVIAALPVPNLGALGGIETPKHLALRLVHPLIPLIPPCLQRRHLAAPPAVTTNHFTTSRLSSFFHIRSFIYPRHPSLSLPFQKRERASAGQHTSSPQRPAHHLGRPEKVVLRLGGSFSET